MFNRLYSDVRETILIPLLENMAQYKEILKPLFYAIIIFIATWIAAKIVQVIIRYILRIFHWFDKLSDKTGFTRFLEHSGLHNIPSITISNLIYWIILFIGFTAAVDHLGVPAYILVQQLIIYIPNALLSVFMVIIGIAVALLLSRLLQSAIIRAGIREGVASFVKNILFTAIAGFSIYQGIKQLEVDQKVLNAIIGNIIQWSAIAVAIAFGLGGRHIASDIVGSFKLKKLYPKGTEINYDDVKGVLKEVGWFDSLVYTEKGIVNIPNSSLAKKIIKRKI